jgi:exodeoxyribonuclease V gamma subunit
MKINPRIGDRSRRNDDKYLFLEALVSARKKFYISYVGQSIKDNSLIPPSVLVSELIDYIKEGFGLSEECVVTLHRLQAFSPEYYKVNSNLFSYSRENFIARRNIYDDHKEIPSLISAKLTEPDQEWKKLAIDNFCAFFGNPARFLLEKRLGICLYDTIPASDEREKFSLDNLEKYMIGQDLVENRLSGSDLNNSLFLQKAMGQLPHGNVGDYVFNEMSVDAEAFVRKTKEHIKGEPFDDLDADLDIAGYNLFGRLTDIHEHGLIQIRYANTKPKYLLNTWIYHLILNMLNEDKYPAKSFLICKDTAWEFACATNSKDVLKNLLELFWQGMSEPLHFFPESSFEYAQKVLIKNQTKQAALNFAQKKWIGSDFSRGESEDPYFELCFGKTDPLDKDFEKIAEKIFAPLLDHCTEIIL